MGNSPGASCQKEDSEANYVAPPVIYYLYEMRTPVCPLPSSHSRSIVPSSRISNCIKLALKASAPPNFLINMQKNSTNVIILPISSSLYGSPDAFSGLKMFEIFRF